MFSYVKSWFGGSEEKETKSLTENSAATTVEKKQKEPSLWDKLVDKAIDALVEAAKKAVVKQITKLAEKMVDKLFEYIKDQIITKPDTANNEKKVTVLTSVQNTQTPKSLVYNQKVGLGHSGTSSVARLRETRKLTPTVNFTTSNAA